MENLLSLLILLPLAGAAVVAFLPGLRPEPARVATFVLMVATFVLSRVGYAANQDQNPETLTAIKALFSLAPAIASALCIFALLFYRLSRHRFDQITRALTRPEAQPANPRAQAARCGQLSQTVNERWARR